MNINNIRIRPLSWVKRLFVKSNAQPLRVPFGLYKGVILELDLATQTQEYLGFHERETHRHIRAEAQRVKWMIDVGAGKGELSAYFLQSTRCKVIALEPEGTSLAAFERTIERNGLDRLRLEIIQGFAGRGDEAGSVRLDTLNVDRKQPGFIKIDVDGCELDVLAGAEALIDHGDVDLLVEVHSPYLEEETMRFLRQHAYDPVIVPNAKWRVLLPEHRPLELNRWISARRQ
jgi:hypothetical protein